MVNNTNTAKFWDLFASKDDDGVFHDIFTSKKAVLCCADNAHPVRVNLTDSNQIGTHWGWLDADGSISMIFSNRRSLELCFPYGLDDAIKRDEGRPVEVTVIAREINIQNPKN
jgi:hypothetical protein